MNKPAKSHVRVAIMGMKLIFFATFAAGSLAAADPAWKKELTSPAPGTHPPVPPGTLDLQLSWKGMLDSGKLRVEFSPENAKKPGAMVIRSSASSLGPAASIFPYRNNFWSEIDPLSLQPVFFHAVETDKKETVSTSTRHFSDRVESSESTKNLQKGTSTQTDRIFKFTPVFDIFSAMLHIRSQKLEAGDRISLVVHPFDNPYLLRVKVVGREDHLDRKTIRLSVGMHKIDRKTLELRPYMKLKRDATLWLSDDGARIPIEFRAAVFIGDVRATMTGFQKS